MLSKNMKKKNPNVSLKYESKSYYKNRIFRFYMSFIIYTYTSTIFRLWNYVCISSRKFPKLFKVFRNTWKIFLIKLLKKWYNPKKGNLYLKSIKKSYYNFAPNTSMKFHFELSPNKRLCHRKKFWRNFPLYIQQEQKFERYIHRKNS